jgi:putative ABC transport system permease protein
VIVEFALTLTLLAGAGLAIHSFWNLTRVDLGVRTDHTLTFYLPVPDTRSTNPEQIVAYYRQILEGAGDRTSFSIAGQPLYTDRSQRPVTGFQMVTPDYFQTFGMRLVQGRFLTEQDNASSVRVAMVNQDVANHFLKGLDPLQHRVVIQPPLPKGGRPGPPVEWQNAGVVHNVRSRGFRQDVPKSMYLFGNPPGRAPASARGRPKIQPRCREALRRTYTPLTRRLLLHIRVPWSRYGMTSSPTTGLP